MHLLRYIFSLLGIISVLTASAQIPASNTAQSTIRFTIEKEIKNTDVKNQCNTSTCWSFSALSFLESEIIKSGKPAINLSEMFIVRFSYLKKAEQYIRMHGNTSMAPGGAFHDVTNIIRDHGILTEEAYPGNPLSGNKHDHSELDVVLKAFLDGVLKNDNKISDKWRPALEGILDAYLGKMPEKFDYQGKSYNAKSFSAFLNIRPDDYVELTSFMHHPYYKPFVLEVPDNWAWGLVYNVTLQELTEIAEYALNNNYSVAWAADVSEKGFSFKNSMAIVPLREDANVADLEKDSIFLKPTLERAITPEIRQAAFDDFSTQDDHGMHMVGIAKDQSGKRYFLIKNSWGVERNHAKGYFFCSQAYYQYKTTSIMVNKGAIPKSILLKLGL